ncbi:MAG TPA: PDZ domain-containing protein [Planctomycetota bacterium]|nr:PDZ domain-containing protein [Planctomycetota bacterium]
MQTLRSHAPVLALLWAAVIGCAAPERAPVAVALASNPSGTEYPREDPALIRRELLRHYEADFDRIVTQSRLAMRNALDAAMPIPYLGVDSEPLATGGLRLTAVYADTGAERAGLRIGDVLRRFGDRATDTKADLARGVRSSRVGDSVNLSLERDGKTQTLIATLRPRPEEDEDEDEQFPDLIAPPLGLSPPQKFDFESDATDTLPVAFDSWLGGHGQAPRWIVTSSDHSRILRQASTDKTGIHFPMAIVRDWTASDAVIRVRFRYAGDRIDRAAGVVLRWRDANNYLVARANAAEGDLRIFRVVNGDRRTLPGAIVKGATDDGAWHTLEFRAEGPKLTAVLDGKFETSSYDTYFRAGRAGVWTKSDSISEFDELEIQAIASDR